MSLRTYDPTTGEWLLNFASVRDGRLGPPTIGRFANDRGEFFSDETFDPPRSIDSPISPKISFTTNAGSGAKEGRCRDASERRGVP